MIFSLAKKEDARHIAAIHQQEIGKGFLSSLPVAFLTKLYEAVIESPEGFCIVSKDKKEVVGFIAGTTSVGKFYGFFLKNYFLYSIGVLFLKMFRFSQAKKIIETLLYPIKETKLLEAELLTMAVTKQYQGRGIAVVMFLEFAQQMKQRNVQQVKVLVGEELQPAINFYEKNGFVFLKNTSIHDNKKTRIYVYTIK